MTPDWKKLAEHQLAWVLPALERAHTQKSPIGNILEPKPTEPPESPRSGTRRRDDGDDLLLFGMLALSCWSGD